MLTLTDKWNIKDIIAEVLTNPDSRSDKQNVAFEIVDEISRDFGKDGEQYAKDFINETYINISVKQGGDHDFQKV